MSARDQVADRERRKRRLWQLGATLVVAAAFVAVAIVVSSSGDKKAAPPAKTHALLAGIPQHGIELGYPHAPVTMIEFADLQCPFCRQYTVSVFPELVRRYVRTGKVKMVFRNLWFLGPDSIRAAKVAASAGLQNKLWDVVERFYQEQGDENSGYVNDAFIAHIIRSVPGLDEARTLREERTQLVDAQLKAALAQEKTLGVQSTPTFFLQRGAGKPKRLDYQDFSVGDFAPKIDAALGSR